ncbi:unnamed protein product [marine sediment metagenome]|uniref:HTH gntR-type domain-containing protein n=1 Tax=marine sediment metagenome TaxID=412755 RepID=X0U303_9ZZZZ
MSEYISEKLREGDRFLTVREAARRFGVSKLTAHRGMSELARRRVLEIYPGAGTFVGPAGGHHNSRVKVVHFITSKAERDTILLSGGLKGLMEALPEVSVQLSIEPKEEIPQYLEELWFGQDGRSGVSQGAILSGCSHETRMFFAKNKIPTVVVGHTEEDVDLPYVDYDQREMGYKIGSFLLDKGHDRLGLLLRDRWYPGDTLFLRGVQQAMAERSIAADKLQIHPVAMEDSIAARTIKKILSGPDRPMALICRREAIALACLEVAGELGLHVPRDLALVSTSPTDLLMQRANPPITSVFCDFEKAGRIAGDLLSQRIKGELDGDSQVELPIRLILREST